MPKQQKKPTLTQKRLKAKFQKKYSKLHGQYTGDTSGTVIHRGPRRITFNERRSQFLTHMATVLKGYYDSLPKRSEVEIQSALIDGGLFIISSNKDATAESFYDSLVDKGVKRIRLMMTLYGHFWNTTNQCHTAIFKLLVEQGKMSSEDLDEDFDERTLLDPFETTTYRPELRSIGDDLLEELHYGSDSDSDYEDESDVEIIEID